MDVSSPSGTWSSSPASGTRPPPCAGFSFTMIDDHHAVLFGGSHAPEGKKSNDVYVVDLSRMVSMVETEFVCVIIVC